MRLPSKRSKNRRGAEAVEFAMVIPVLLMFVFGSIDYGWYFWTQALATNHVLTGMRLGGMVKPSDAEIENGGSCAQCISRARDEIVTRLGTMGITVTPSDVQPTLVGIDGNCALLLDTDLDYDPITPQFLMVPTSYNVTLHVVAQGTADCS